MKLSYLSFDDHTLKDYVRSSNIFIYMNKIVHFRGDLVKKGVRFLRPTGQYFAMVCKDFPVKFCSKNPLKEFWIKVNEQFKRLRQKQTRFISLVNPFPPCPLLAP